MNNAIPFALLGAALLLTLPALFWLRREPPRTAAAIILLTVAVACGYTGIQLLHQPAPAPAHAFRLVQVPGQFQVISAGELPAALAAARGRAVLVELYADWCPSCVVWKEQVFSRSDVQAAMTPFVLLQVDASEFTPAMQALMADYGLAGLPAILLFDPEGRERREHRLLGEMAAPDFIRWLDERAAGN